MERRATGLGLVFALLSAATFSTSGSFARSLLDIGWSPGAAVLIRAGIAAVLLAGPVAVALRGRWGVLRQHGAMVVGYGLIAVAGCQVCFFFAVDRLSVGVALLIEYLGIVLVVLWLWVRHRQRPRRLTVAGSVLAVVGLVLILDVTGSARVDAVGVIWAAGAAAGLAVFYLLSARPSAGLPPIAMAGGGLAVGALILALLGAVRVLPMHARYDQVDFAGHRTSWLVPVLGLSVVAAAVAYVLGIVAARTLGPKLASFAGLTEVMFAVLVAWLLLDELPTGLQLVGGVLIIAGVALVRADERDEPMPAPDPELAAATSVTEAAVDR
jgi:drug/metabolite transporter (DMT)-like permease